MYLVLFLQDEGLYFSHCCNLDPSYLCMLIVAFKTIVFILVILCAVWSKRKDSYTDIFPTGIWVGPECGRPDGWPRLGSCEPAVFTFSTENFSWEFAPCGLISKQDLNLILNNHQILSFDWCNCQRNNTY